MLQAYEVIDTPTGAIQPTEIMAKDMKTMTRLLKDLGKTGIRYRVMATHGEVEIVQETIKSLIHHPQHYAENKKDPKTK